MNALAYFSRRALLVAAVALYATLAFGSEGTYGNPLAAKLVQVDVYDRASGRALEVHEKEGRRYIIGVPGHEYAVRIRNCTNRRILAVTSVDGVNVVTGDTASPEQSGYVIEPWGSVEIAGWRKSLSQTNAFFFTEHANSYAARTGRPFDVGVVGVAVFAERAPRVSQGIAEPFGYGSRNEATSADRAASVPAEAPAPSTSGAAKAESRRDLDQARERQNADQPVAKLGTGYGRNETSYVRRVTFERATSTPEQIVALNYDRYENLLAMGVLRAPHLADRTPRPFPGMRFVPEPR